MTSVSLGLIIFSPLGDANVAVTGPHLVIYIALLDGVR